MVLHGREEVALSATRAGHAGVVREAEGLTPGAMARAQCIARAERAARGKPTWTSERETPRARAGKARACAARSVGLARMGKGRWGFLEGT